MQLRDHPLMSYGAIPNWPPTWTKPKGKGLPRCEIGKLNYVWANPILPRKFFLVIEHEGQRYVGCLVFDNENLARQMIEIFKANIGRSIKEIGDLDLSHLL